MTTRQIFSTNLDSSSTSKGMKEARLMHLKVFSACTFAFTAMMPVFSMLNLKNEANKLLVESTPEEVPSMFYSASFRGGASSGLRGANVAEITRSVFELRRRCGLIIRRF